jgi:hypothetical protein
VKVPSLHITAVRAMVNVTTASYTGDFSCAGVWRHALWVGSWLPALRVRLSVLSPKTMLGGTDGLSQDSINELLT